MTPNVKKVRTLLRVSSRQQLHDNDIPIQRAEAEHYISGRPDWVFDKEYIEKAVSAYKNSVKDREVLMEILEDAKERQFDILLTYVGQNRQAGGVQFLCCRPQPPWHRSLDDKRRAAKNRRTHR